LHLVTCTSHAARLKSKCADWLFVLFAAAALWTLDGAFEVAAAGAVGINLHQGAGQNLYTGERRASHTAKARDLALLCCSKVSSWTRQNTG
jgi:hypothetical protein